MKHAITSTRPGRQQKKIIRKYYEKLYTYKFGNSNEMDQFLANHKLPK